MQINLTAGGLDKQIGDGLILGILDQDELTGAAAEADRLLDGALSELRRDGGLPAKKGDVTIVHTLGRLGLKRLACVGLGTLDDLDLETIRVAAAAGWKRLRAESAREILAVVPGDGQLEPAQAAETLVEGILLQNYSFRKYRPVSDEAEPALAILGEPALADALRRGIEVGQAKGEGTALTRDLVNTAPSDLTPLDLVAAAQAMADEVGLTCTVLDQEELEARGFHLILAVNRGSREPCALITLEHKGGDGPALGLVGKGVCFDTGGLSIKPSDGMMTMKGDMAGAAAVLGAMRAAARLKVPINVTAVIPTVYNLVDADSIKPGDIVTGLGGKSVEILNTDAEGRLILADALTYATGELGLTPVVNIATLTGACIRALGPVYAGVFGTSPELVERIRQVGRQAGEKFWELPLDDEYGELMKGSIADLRNIGKTPNGGASSAAMFLREFVGDTPWAHLDIAGQAISDSEKPYRPVGATGYGARTLLNLVISLAKRGLG